ncbi:conserved hypothetical protein [Candidatus Protochlamydia naegleriophila]|uniref:DUF2937 family protein n=1 Tax=Candidatus Protochlamydia naegleriophila TaxID=389348 RepID=A0A0U5JFY8_9BACT|nr:DUF2937 family protein [Candidatus Protochlamydia naegleriophila]CUI16805.1 conserved hypothetical protein [Candidatus Protochlamydia naegleriophila]
MKCWQLMDRILDRLFVVMGAFIGSQIPEFMQQYTQRLAGHVSELNHLLDGLRQVAANSGKTLEEYIHKFVINGDPDFVRQGEFMQGMVSRWQELSQALTHLTESSFLGRPFVFFTELNYPIAKAAFAAYQPGLNLTLEGLSYTGIGILTGYFFYQLLSKIVAIGCRRAVSFIRPGV